MNVLAHFIPCLRLGPSTIQQQRKCNNLEDVAEQPTLDIVPKTLQGTPKSSSQCKY